MNILLIGSGGREHALARAIAASPLCSHLYIAPGNTGTAQVGTNVPLMTEDFEQVYNFVEKENITMVVIGPEQPLVDGLADFLRGLNINVIGPGKDGAALEGSKSFSKAFMQRWDIPTASSQTFQAFEKSTAKEFVRNNGLPIVIKASGLAAGKGVVIAETLETADQAIDEMLSGRWFGLSGETIVIESFLKGIEMSVFVLTDGENYTILPSAKDYKRVGEGDTGLNTGGMGAVSPVPFVTTSLMTEIENSIIIPTLKGLQSEDIYYCGFIFFGIMVVNDKPYLLEYNCRMGDPETEVVIPRIETDLVALFEATCKGQLNTVALTVNPAYCTTIMLVSGGYPEAFEKGKVITGVENVQDAFVFHAGVKQEGNQLVTAGGRVMAVTALGSTLPQALSKSLKAANAIQFENKYFRKDIGEDVMKYV